MVKRSKEEPGAAAGESLKKTVMTVFFARSPIIGPSQGEAAEGTMDLGLKGKKAIVTGATKGIGRAIVDLLASEGVDVGFCARDEDEVRRPASLSSRKA